MEKSNALLRHLSQPPPRKRRSRRSGEDDGAPEPASGNRLARTTWWLGAAAIAAGMALIGAATGGMIAWLHDTPPVLALENYDPPEMTILVDRHGQPFARLFDEQRRVVRLNDLSVSLPDAFIAIEDTAFREHLGIQPKGIVRAAVMNFQRGTTSQGASTITQQLARNLLPNIGREKTYTRKLREMATALRIERRHTKDQILEVYLNQIYLGSGTYGVEAAARRYFGKGAHELELAEIALIAGLPQLPERFSPLNDIERSRERRDLVLERMHNLGWVRTEEYLAARESAIVLARPEAGLPSLNAFVDAVRREAARSLQLEPARLRAEGLRIETTLDPEAQAAAENALREGLAEEQAHWLENRPARFAEEIASGAFDREPQRGQVRMARVVRVFGNSVVVELGGGWRADLEFPERAPELFRDAGLQPGDGVDVELLSVDESGERRLWQGRLLPRTPLQGAVVVLDRQTGEVRALVGGRPPSEGSAPDYYNRAVQARRQAGSTLKPFFFAAAMERGMTPDTFVYDAPIEFAGGYSPRNYENRFFGRITLEDALSHSRNVSTVRLVHEMGLRSTLDFVRRFDVLEGAPHWHLPMEIPVVLGTPGVTPMELAAAYLPFANGGQAMLPRTVAGVRHSDGRVVRQRLNSPVAVMDARTTALMVQMLAATMSHGTGRDARGRLPESLRDGVAGKTGTTNDFRDAWFAGFTGEDVVVVWMGFDQPLPLGDGRGGGRAAGPIWARVVGDLWESRGGPTDQWLAMPVGWRLELQDGMGRAVASPSATAGGSYVLRAVPDVASPDSLARAADFP